MLFASLARRGLSTPAPLTPPHVPLTSGAYVPPRGPTALVPPPAHPARPMATPDLVNYTPGRSSVSGLVATVFGCTGFVGRYVVNELGRIGSQVVVPYRGSDTVYRHLKVMGDLGQIVPARYDPQDTDSIAAALADSNVVINLVGQERDTRNFTQHDVHVKFATTVARLAKEAGVERLVHMSALGADHKSESEFGRCKYEAEHAVRTAFPGATILRPAKIFGPEDRLLMKFGWLSRWSVYPSFGRLDRRFQPVSVHDVATAVLKAVIERSAVGRTYELVGTREFNMRQFHEMVVSYTERDHNIYPLPVALGKFLSNLFKYTRYNFWNADQVAFEQEDQVLSPGALTFADLGIAQSHLRPIELDADLVLRSFRPPLPPTIKIDQYTLPERLQLKAETR